jgi:hypothetical protein
MRSCVRPSTNPGAIGILMSAGIVSAADPGTVRILVRASVRSAADPRAIRILMRAGIRVSADPGAIRILMRTRVRATTDPGAVWILMRAGVRPAADPGAVRILMRATVGTAADPGAVGVLVCTRIPSRFKSLLLSHLQSDCLVLRQGGRSLRGFGATPRLTRALSRNLSCLAFCVNSSITDRARASQAQSCPGGAAPTWFIRSIVCSRMVRTD